MKIKSESNVLHGKSKESWRNTDKGIQALAKSQQHKAGPLFKIAGYVRLSPSGDEREEGSLVSHPQRIKQFVESKNIQNDGAWGEIIDWYVDKDFSGKDMNRPAFQRMLVDLKAGRVNAVIVTELSRLSRFVRDFCEIQEFFKQHRVAFFSLRENFDTSTPAGELMLMQTIAFAQFERHSIVDRIKKGARARAERGLGNGYVPLGFKLVEHRPNHREIDPNEKPYVEMIFRKLLELKRLGAVVQHLNENGYKTKEFISKCGKKIGGNRWTISSLHSLVTNRTYIGQREFNKRFRSALQCDLKEDDKYFYVDAQWPALISKEIYDDVQKLLERNRQKARKYVHQYRLTGLIRCTQCGESLVGKSGTGKSGTYFYYGHKRRMTAGNDQHLNRCKVENISAIQIEETVIVRLRELANDRILIEELAKNMVRSARETFEHKKSLALVRENDRKRLQQKVNNLLESIAETDDKIIRNGLTSKLRELQDQLEKIELTIGDLGVDIEDSGSVVDVGSVFLLLKIFRSEFEKTDISVQTEILRDIIAEISVKEDGILIKIFGLSSDNTTKKRPAMSRSGVRTVSKLVDVTGIEPATLNMPC